MSWLSRLSQMDIARKIHGAKYDYSAITEAHVETQKSRVPITCLICYYKWEPVIDHHIHNRIKCPQCTHRIPWNLESFVEAARMIHGNKYDYSEIKEEDIKNAHCKVPINCNICWHNWKQTISHHINYENGCPKCVNQIPMTREIFIEKALLIHGDDIDFSEITDEDVKTRNSRVSLKCNICEIKWKPEIRSIIYNKSGCPGCKMSKGERACRNILESMNIIYERQFRIKSLPTRSYDFEFEFDGIKWIVEYDS